MSNDTKTHHDIPSGASGAAPAAGNALTGERDQKAHGFYGLLLDAAWLRQMADDANLSDKQSADLMFISERLTQIEAAATRSAGGTVRAPSEADLTLAADLLVRLTNSHATMFSGDDVRALASRLRATALAARPTSGGNMETAEQQIDRLARFIMEEIPGEPSQSEGAVDTAIRLLRRPAVPPAGAALPADHHPEKGET